MIVARRTFKAVRGRARELAKFLVENDTPSENYRVYIAHSGEAENVVIDNEFESLAEYEQKWTAFFAKISKDGSLAKVMELTTGSHLEFFEIVK